MLDETHAPAARAWLASANQGGDFPLQNLPYGACRRKGSAEPFWVGVAIGDSALNLGTLSHSPVWATLGPGLDVALAQRAAQAAATDSLNALMALGPDAWQALRLALFRLLRADAAPALQREVQACLTPLDDLEHQIAVRVGEYTDFYTSLHHARNVGQAIGNGGLVPPNFFWMPVAYHGRASSLGVNQQVRRPVGQVMAPGAASPVVGPSQRLDYELEMAIYVGQGNAQGTPVPVAEAESHIFGLGLLNDWSARDIQFWEMAPLGPFQGKNFATTLSPWVVTLAALAPFRLPFERAPEFPPPLPYLDSPALRDSGALDIELSVTLQSAAMRGAGQAGETLSRTNFRHQHWCIAQMLAHHTLGGCNLRPGDLLGSGTVSGPTPAEAGALIELSQAGQRPVALSNGEYRAFLQDGDAIALSAWCERPGAVRIGFGTARGEVLPALG
jgi:fumarylacetoacetase